MFKGLLDVGKSAWAKLIDGAKAYGEEQKRLKEEGLRMWEETLTPVQRYQQEIARATELLKAGAITLQQFKDIQNNAQKPLQEEHQRSQEDLHQTALDVLRQEADLGDKAAEKELKKIELQDRYLEQKKKLLAIEQSTTSTADEKKQAAALLADLDSMQGKEPAEKKKKDQTVGPADLEVSQYLTGVSARAEQQKAEYDPIVQAQKEQTGIVKQIADMFGGWIGASGNKIEQIVALK